MTKTGRFGFLFDGEKEGAIQRAAETVSRHVLELAKDGREYLIRTRRSISVSEMFVGGTRQFKVIFFVALEDYRQAEIGECCILPYDFYDLARLSPPLDGEVFTRPGEYRDNEGERQDCDVRVIKIGDLWFEEDFVLRVNLHTYRRVEKPDNITPVERTGRAI